jgi:hypothetical protein
MDDEVLRRYLRRADEATSVEQLHAIADEAGAAFPNDADAERVKDVCFAYATERIRRGARGSATRPIFGYD